LTPAASSSSRCPGTAPRGAIYLPVKGRTAFPHSKAHPAGLRATPQVMHLVLAGTIIRRKRHESVLRCVMGSGSSSDPERSKNAVPEKARRPARTATEQRVDSITSDSMRSHAVGLDHSTLHYYFPTKVALIEAVAEAAHYSLAESSKLTCQERTLSRRTSRRWFCHTSGVVTGRMLG
jgi:hypothetical protein